MLYKTYRSEYLPLFYKDLDRALAYIRGHLCNPSAAAELAKMTHRAIKDRMPMCEAFPKFYSKRDRAHPYFFIRVKNYYIYYVVIDDGDTKTMQMRRFLYKGQDRSRIL